MVVYNHAGFNESSMIIQHSMVVYSPAGFNESMIIFTERLLQFCIFTPSSSLTFLALFTIYTYAVHLFQ